MVLNTIQKIWKSGSTLCVSIPKEVKTILDLNAGDMIQIAWDEVIKQKDFVGEKPYSRKGLVERPEMRSEKIQEINKEDIRTEIKELPNLDEEL